MITKIGYSRTSCGFTRQHVEYVDVTDMTKMTKMTRFRLTDCCVSAANDVEMHE